MQFSIYLNRRVFVLNWKVSVIMCVIYSKLYELVYNTQKNSSLRQSKGKGHCVLRVTHKLSGPITPYKMSLSPSQKGSSL